MAQMPTTEPSTGPDIAEAFVADRIMFWKRFGSFVVYAVIAVVVIVVGLWLFVA